VLNALGSLVELALELELVVDDRGVVSAAVAPPAGASTTPAALDSEPPLELEPQAATTPPVAAATQRMVSVLRMNAAGG
jgi:hypothetical protein